MSNVGLLCRKYVDRAMIEYELPRSEASTTLLCMIAAHESGGFRYCQQIGGPAVSIFQMEPVTFYDVSQYAQRKGYCYKHLPPHPNEMIFDFGFAAAMSRIFFLRIPEAIPHEEDLEAISEYAKKYWNTSAGKATPELYLKAYQEHFEQ